MKLGPVLATLGLATLAMLSACRTTSSGSTLREDGVGGGPPPGAVGLPLPQDVTYIWVKDGQVTKGSCPAGAPGVQGCQVIKSLPVEQFKQNLTRGYLQQTGAQELSKYEQTVMNDAIQFATIGGQRPEMPLERFLDLMSRFSGIIETALNSEPAKQPQAAQNGANLAEGDTFLQETAIIQFAGQIVMSPAYQLFQVQRSKQLYVELGGCQNQGWRIAAVNVSTNGNPFLGSLRRTGPGLYESNTPGRVLDITAMQFQLAPNPTGFAPATCFFRVTNRDDGSGGGGGGGGGGDVPCEDMGRAECTDNAGRCEWDATDRVCRGTGGGGGGTGCGDMSQPECDDNYPRCRWRVSLQRCVDG